MPSESMAEWGWNTHEGAVWRFDAFSGVVGGSDLTGSISVAVAAILPFIELGMSEDSDCLKWIAEAEHQAD